MYPKTPDEIEKAKRDCEKMLTKRSLASAAAGLSPIVGTDITADMALLLDLLPKINRRFGFAHEQIESLDEKYKVVIYQLIRVTGKKLVGKCITKELVVAVLKRIGIRIGTKQVAKYIPFVGLVVSCIISYGGMKYMGRTHINECVELANDLLKERTT